MEWEINPAFNWSTDGLKEQPSNGTIDWRTERMTMYLVDQLMDWVNDPTMGWSTDGLSKRPSNELSYWVIAHQFVQLSKQLVCQLIRSITICPSSILTMFIFINMITIVFVSLSLQLRRFCVTISTFGTVSVSLSLPLEHFLSHCLYHWNLLSHCLYHWRSFCLSVSTMKQNLLSLLCSLKQFYVYVCNGAVSVSVSTIEAGFFLTVSTLWAVFVSLSLSLEQVL